jgi:hypothetical protein
MEGFDMLNQFQGDPQLSFAQTSLETEENSDGSERILEEKEKAKPDLPEFAPEPGRLFYQHEDFF